MIFQEEGVMNSRADFLEAVNRGSHTVSVCFWMSSEEPCLMGSMASEARESRKKWRRC